MCNLRLLRGTCLAFGFILMAWIDSAQALPAFARQTGMACAACHVSFPELTPFGRLFKLSGYTLGTAQKIPFAAMLIGSNTQIANTGGQNGNFPRNNEPVLEGGSVFLAGKINDHIGMFSQWTENNLTATSAPDGSTSYRASFAIDNNDWRIADHISKQDLDLIYGLTLNNNPTVQDVWNSTPAFAYPFQSSSLAGSWGYTPPAPLISGGLAHQVAGVSAYGFLNKHWYLELGSYQAAEGTFSILSHEVAYTNRLQGNNPYWRLAYSTDWGVNSLSFGTFGLAAKVYSDPNNPGSPTNRYLDQGVDLQYQYLSDPNIFTTQLYYITEHSYWDSSLVNSGTVQNAGDTLNSFQAKASYWYQRTYGLTLSYFNITGSSDLGLYQSDPTVPQYSATGSPNTNGFIAELNYMIQPNWRVGLQYIDYRRFMGASTNYDGNGRNAKDNNTTYLYTWVVF